MPFETCFVGKKVLVTGAARPTGIGRVITAALQSRGAIVYALSKTKENLTLLQKDFPNVIPICVDLADWKETRKVLEPLECMDILINNAGIAEPANFLDVTPEEFDMHMSVNAKAVLNVSQVVSRKMIAEERRGSIINVSSVAGVRALVSASAYCASKAALEMLSKVMAMELGPHQITVNCINPAQVKGTELQLKWSEGANLDALNNGTPTNNSIMPMDDVVNAVLFLSSRLTTQITGSRLAIDGGYLAA